MNYNPIKLISEQVYNYLTIAEKLNEKIQNHPVRETKKKKKCFFWINRRDLLNNNTKVPYTS